MTSRRVQCLVEANKKGLNLYYDPPTVRNRYFYRRLAKSLDIAEDDVVEMIESFMIYNEVISCKHTVSLLLFPRRFRKLYAFTKILHLSLRLATCQSMSFASDTITIS